MGSGASTSMTKAKRGSSSSSATFNGSAGRRSLAVKSPSSLPAPLPPSNRKDDIFKEADFQQVHEHVRAMPQELNYGTFRELATFLTSPEDWDDLDKLRAIFLWATSVDVFHVQTDPRPAQQSPMEYFQKIQNNEGNHAHLVDRLCRMAGIACTIISGMNKSAAYEIGRRTNRQKMGAQWNAVYVCDSWRFVDTFWASACVVGKRSGEWALVDSENETVDDAEEATEGETQHRINEFYFLPDPDQLVWTHFPDHEEWQLLEHPISIEQFENHLYIRERFHLLGMITVTSTRMDCVTETVNGQIEFTFGLPPDQSSNYRFKYILYRSRSDLSHSKVDVFLDRFVLLEQTQDWLKLSLRFPIKGSFKLDIYGLDTRDADVFDLCCTYIINCPQAKANCLPLPDCPALGWGPGTGTKLAGLTPLTHKQAEIVSNDGVVEIRFALEKAIAFHQLLKHSILDEATLSRYCVSEQDSEEAAVYLRLPQNGEYGLKLFAQGLDDSGPAKNVLNYLIHCRKSATGGPPFPNLTTGLLGRNTKNSWQLQVQAVSHPAGQLDAQDGKLSVKFRANSDVQLLCEMHTTDGIAAKKMSKVITNSDDNYWTFDLDMPVKGEYSLNVFASREGETGQIYSVHSYLIKSGGRDNVNDDDGDDEAVDTSIPTETVDTSDAEVMIPLPPGCSHVLAAVHRRDGYEVPDPRQIQFFSQDDIGLVKVQLKDCGEYMLNLYDTRENGNTLQNVAKYQINRRHPGELYPNNLSTLIDKVKSRKQSTPLESGNRATSLEDDVQQQARRNVQNALDLKDIRHLEDAIKSYIACGLSQDDPLVMKAKQLVEILAVKAELMDASQERQLGQLESAIARAKRFNTNHELDLQIALAVRLRDHLAKIEKLRHAVLDMEPKTISEIKSYSKPPDGVHQCMIATFLLLGHQLKEVKEWQKVQALLGKTGKESVMRKISSFDAEQVALRRAQVAKKMIEPYNKEQIRDVSAGAATFYFWAVGMIEEVESYGGAKGKEQLRLEK